MSNLSNPLVSIVVASYNHSAYIEKTIKSLASQDYSSIELIVIDDGSTDGSGELLEVLQNKYKFKLIRRSNGGLVSVVNLGISVANGEYIIIHASDDESFPSRVSAQVEIIQKYPKAGFISGNVLLVDERGENKGTALAEKNIIKEFSFEDIFLQKELVSSVACMYRLSVLREIGGISEKYKAEDPQIFLRITNAGYTWIQWSGPPVIVYRMLFTSLSRTVLPLLIRQGIDLINEFPTHPQHTEALMMRRSGLLSALAEVNKLEAIKEAFNGKNKILSRGFLRFVIKVALPKGVHGYFKKSGLRK